MQLGSYFFHNYNMTLELIRQRDYTMFAKNWTFFVQSRCHRLEVRLGFLRRATA